MDFQTRRLAGADISLDHAIVGALVAEQMGLFELALAIAGHHGGIPDKQGGAGLYQTFRERKLKALQDRETVSLVSGFVSLMTNISEIQRFGYPDTRTRMLASCLVDADYLDTERHYSPEKTASRQNSVRGFNDLLDRLLVFNASQDRRTPIGKARQRLFERCLAAGTASRGIFRLEAPTGAGKTFSSVAFAIRHAIHNGMDRVICAMPYTSIIEQNADALRSALGHDVVLEHQSASLEMLDQGPNKLAAENWAGFPVVVTTNVQLFESLFGNTPSRIRKLHNICNSVLVLDEVQALPPELLKPTLSMLNDLRKNYGVSVVLSTATQPGFDNEIWGFGASIDLAPGTADDPVWNRVNIEHIGEADIEHLAARIAAYPQCLAVVNTRKDARTLAGLLPGCLHLSSSMCPSHRRSVLSEIRKRLSAGGPCVLIATQVVEAGCDISFPVGFRAAGPLDGILQVAGRINRHGEFGGGRLFIVSLTDGGRVPGSYNVACGIAKDFIKNNQFSGADQARYFDKLYGPSGCLDLDRRNIQELRKNAMFSEVAHKYRLIEETVSVVVPYGKSEELLRRFEVAGRMFMRDYREIQQYMVHIRPNELAMLHCTQRAGLVFCQNYSEIFGIGDALSARK